MSLSFHHSSRIGFHSAICLTECDLATEWYERRNRVERSEVEEEEEEEVTWLQSCECSRYLRTLHHPSSHPPPLIILLTQSNSPSHHSKRTQSLQTTQERKRSAQPSIHFQNCELFIYAPHTPQFDSSTRRKKQSRPVCIQEMKSQGCGMCDQKAEKRERGGGILKR